MNTNGTLSRFLKEFLKEYDRDEIEENVPPEEREEDIRFRTYFRDLTREILGAVESIKTPRTLEYGSIEEMPSPFREFEELQIDAAYTRDMLDRIPKMVRRTLRLSTMPRSDKPPSRETNLYLREATRSYVFGFWQASIALSRTAVEAALKEKVDRHFVSACDSLIKLISAAEKTRVLDHAASEMAYQVAKHGNEVLHGTPQGEDVAWTTLTGARGVLGYIYARSKV
ncbi:MAG: DUF4145 domain-containing protein [Acidobacteriota bacterium]|jgi:hypothetical protein